MNGGMIGRRNVPGIDGYSGVWSLREVANSRRAGVVWPARLDTFDTDSTGNYTQYADSAGTWSVSGGELVATGGTQSVFIINGVSLTNGWVEVDCNFATNAGIVLRFIDNNNYYFLNIGDDSGSVNNLLLHKRVAGGFTTIGATSNIAWARGTSRKIRLAVSGASFTIYVDGSEVATMTDGSITGAGGVGMRNTAGTTKFQTFSLGF